MEEIKYPVRINKYLAYKKISTRRGADDLISAGLIKINGKKAVLGDKVNKGDEVDVSDKAKKNDYKYIAYYKPRGVVTHSPQEGEKAVTDLVDIEGVFPVGRLDKESDGLIILTNDGRVTERLLHPRFKHEKEYKVVVREKVSKGVISTLEKGVIDNSELLKIKSAEIVDDHTLSIILIQGKKHQIRRMLSHVRLTVEKLKRVRIMNVVLKPLSSGKMRTLAGKAKDSFLKDLDLL